LGSEVGTEHRNNAGEDSETSVLSRHEVKQPRRFAVVLHNDDYTTMEFVVLVLMRFFGRNETEAAKIMLEVHHKGKGVAGVYVRDVAESKVEQVEEFARTEGHPLKCTTEPVEGVGDDSGVGGYGPHS
jgi:ATP-dependent Clp protease adaptor protein ClpS